MTPESLFSDPVWVNCWDSPDEFDGSQEEYDSNREKAEDLLRNLRGDDYASYLKAINDAFFKLEMMHHDEKKIFRPVMIKELGNALGYQVLNIYVKYTAIQANLLACAYSEFDQFEEKKRLTCNELEKKISKLQEWLSESPPIALSGFMNWCENKGLEIPESARNLRPLIFSQKVGQKAGLCNLISNEQFEIIYKELVFYSYLENISLDSFIEIFRNGGGVINWLGDKDQLSCMIRKLKEMEKFTKRPVWPIAEKIFLFRGNKVTRLKGADKDIKSPKEKIITGILRNAFP